MGQGLGYGFRGFVVRFVHVGEIRQSWSPGLTGFHSFSVWLFFPCYFLSSWVDLLF